MLSTAAWNAFLKTLEEPPAEHGLRARHDGGQQGPAHRRRPLPSLRLPPPDGGADSERRAPRRAGRVDRDPAGGGRGAGARRLPGSFRDALGTLEQLVTYSGSEIALEDVLAVLGRGRRPAARRDGRRGRRGRRPARADGDGGVRRAGPRRGLLRHRPGGPRSRAADRADPRRGAGRAVAHARGRRGAGRSRPSSVDHATVVRLLELLGEAMEARPGRRRRAHAPGARSREGRTARGRRLDARAAARIERLRSRPPSRLRGGVSATRSRSERSPGPVQRSGRGRRRRSAGPSRRSACARGAGRRGGDENGAAPRPRAARPDAREQRLRFGSRSA